MKNLVTGGAGFIGQHLVRQLLARGEQVRVLDLARPREAPASVEVLHGSVTDPEAVAHAVAGVDCVFHMAANAHLWARDKSVFNRVNHQGTQIVLAAARTAGVPRFVHTSSLTVLVGRSMRGAERLVSEDTLVPETEMLGPYCLSKWRAEAAARAMNGPDCAVTSVLPTLPMGPGDEGLTAPTRMLIDLVNGAIPAYLDCLHNIIHVEDVAAGHILARDLGAGGARYILGGDTVSMGDLVAMLGRLTALPMPSARVPYALALAAGHVAEWISDTITRTPPQAPLTGVRLAGRPVRFDTTRARTQLGLTPRPAQAALRDALTWANEAGHVTRPLPDLSAAPL